MAEDDKNVFGRFGLRRRINFLQNAHKKMAKNWQKLKFSWTFTKFRFVFEIVLKISFR